MTSAKPIPVAVPAVPVNEPEAPVLEEPVAGGNYVRDPVTGVLSLNPSHLSKVSSLE